MDERIVPSIRRQWCYGWQGSSIANIRWRIGSTPGLLHAEVLSASKLALQVLDLCCIIEDN